MTEGRTVWWAKDAAWWRRERIVELGEEFGSLGPAVIDWLACEAKAQNEGGRVKAGYRSLARGIFSEVVPVCPVVSRAVELGLLDDFQETGRTFTCRISGWSSEQQRVREAVKKAAQRADKRSESPALSPGVPKSPPTGQDRTEELPTPLPPLQGGRQRDKDARREWVRSLAADFPNCDAAEGLAWLAVNAGADTAEDVRAYIAERIEVAA